MNEIEETNYKEIKRELIESKFDKKVDSYFTNKNELTHYYNVGKMLIDAQGGESIAKYGDGLIKKYSERLTKEIGKGYSTRTLKLMRKFYLFQKGQTVSAQSLSWSHYVVLMTLDDINKINYYIMLIDKYHLSIRALQERIKNKEYQRLDDVTKNKLINKEETNVYDLIKNPIYINAYNEDISLVFERILKKFILRDISNFLKQLGNGFCYIANEYKIKIGNRFNYIDLLLFNYEYNCFVIIELKITELKKEHIGQIQIYINYIDSNLRKINQDKTIDIIICKQDNKYIIKYSSDPRIIAREYELV